MRSRARRLTIGALLFALGVVVGSATGGTLAAFSSSTDNTGNSFGAKQIFPGVRTTSAWDLHDAADGSDANVSTPIAFVDASLYTTGNWTSSFSSTRYVEISYNSPLPAGLTVSSPQFNFTFASNAGSETSCFYFEVYNGTSLIGTHGSTSSPVACLTSATQTTYNTAISEVSTTDIANNSLKVRVYVKESNSKPIKIDAATVSGTFASTSFTLYRTTFNDQSTGTASSTVWGPPLADSNAYVTTGNWANAFSTTRYLKFTFAAYVPSGATISSVTFNHSYKGANSGDNVCYYFEVYNSTTLLATHGSSSSPVSCNSTTSYATDNVSLTEVDTPTKADNLVIKVFMKNSGAHKTNTDLATVSIDYYVN